MKLRLIADYDHEKKQPRATPVEHYKKCPSCGCRDLIEVRPDILCASCDWNSIAWDVSHGAMDDLQNAAKEFGLTILEPLASVHRARNTWRSELQLPTLSVGEA
jgi:hypothetical protein